MYTPEMALVNEPSGGVTFRDLPFWGKLDTLKLNSSTPISDDLIRLIEALYDRWNNILHSTLTEMERRGPCIESIVTIESIVSIVSIVAMLSIFHNEDFHESNAMNLLQNLFLLLR